MSCKGCQTKARHGFCDARCAIWREANERRIIAKANTQHLTVAEVREMEAKEAEVTV
jgi:hypothetical protein